MLNSKSQLLLKAARTILRPLVKLLLAHQITYNDLTKLLKSLYIETAENEFQLSSKPQTDSRLSLLTGIHRKEVKNLRQQLLEEPEESLSSAIPAQLVATWLGDPRFTDTEGHPHRLALYASDKKDETPAFEELVQQISKGDLRVTPIFNECEHLGLITLDDADQVVLNTSTLISSDDFANKVLFFAENLGAHMKTCCHNLLLEHLRAASAANPNGENHPANKQLPQFDRSVSYNNLTPEAIRELQSLLENEGMELLKLLNRNAKQAQQARNRAEPIEQRDLHRMTIGLYFHSESQTIATTKRPPQRGEKS